MASSFDEDDWGRPTRLEGWTVADLCGHAGLTALRQAEAYRRAAVGTLESPEFPGVPALSSTEILEQFADGSAVLGDALAGLTSEVLDGLTPMPFGVVPTMVALQVSVFEFAFHANDLRDAIGDAGPFPTDVASVYVRLLPGLAPTLAGQAEPGRAEHAYRLVAPSGSVTLVAGDDGWAVVEDTDELLCVVEGSDDVIALFTFGRISADDPRLSMSGSAASKAVEFKRWFPGP